MIYNLKNCDFLYRKKERKSKIVVITGPMFSGKTSRLLEFIERESIAGKNVLLFKPEIDKRYSKNSVVTHKGYKVKAIISPINFKAGDFIAKKSREADVVGIDEAQFWDENIHFPEFLDMLADSGKVVYVSTLNTDHRGKAFKNSKDLLGLADKVYTLAAVCTKCGGEATFTQRIVDNKPVFGDTILIGGKNLYEPRCRECFVRKQG